MLAGEIYQVREPCGDTAGEVLRVKGRRRNLVFHFDHWISSFEVLGRALADEVPLRLIPSQVERSPATFSRG